MGVLSRRVVLAGLSSFAFAAGAGTALHAQEVRGLRSERERDRLNSNRIGLMTGGPGGNYFAVMPDITGASGVRTWFKGYCYAGGFQYARRSGADLTVINFVDLDDYVQGVVPYEMNATWPVETLKAGGVHNTMNQFAA